MLIKKKKSKPSLPTMDEFLKFKPGKSDFKWCKNEEGLVEIQVIKFKGRIGKSFCKMIRRDNFFSAKMDKLGSIAWEYSDGKNTVEDLIEIIRTRFPNEENIDQRLVLFIQQMGLLGYMTY